MVSVLPFPKAKKLIPSGRRCRVTFRTAAFRQEDGTLDSLVITCDDMQTEQVDPLLQGYREQGSFLVAGSDDSSARWIPWPVACVEVKILDEPQSHPVADESHPSP